MAITREQLKVGETYLDSNGKTTRRVIFIGDEYVVYKYNDHNGDGEGESIKSISTFIYDNNIIPKPKTKVYLYEINGLVGHSYFQYLKDEDLTRYKILKKLEEYYIEVSDE